MEMDMEKRFLTRGQRILSVMFCMFLATACKDGGKSSKDDAGKAPNHDSIDTQSENLLAACTASSSLIETTEWTSCLEGKTLSGSEPFTNKSCELRIKVSGAFDYVRDNAIAISVPERSVWKSATGTYQNNGTGASRIFLASVAPDLPAATGQPRVTNINISLFGLSSQQDIVAVQYLDESLARQTYNCNVKAL
jgi:hypothetical protein